MAAASGQRRAPADGVLVTCVCVAAVLVAALWVLMIASIPRYGREHGLPVDGGRPLADVRICVPARDEAANIAACVSAARAAAPGAEIVVVDDDSSDGTGAIARAAAVDVTVRAAPPRPSGWSGKAWACQVAADGAEARWLLFVDADVRLAPLVVSSLVVEAERAQRDLLSVFGTWRLVTFWERVAIPAIGWFIRGSVDLAAVERGDRAFANGQVLLVKRSTWSSLGGHGAVRGAVLDDVELARAVRRSGGAVGVRYAPWAFEVRLYDSLSAILAGYGKNLFEGMERRRSVAVAAVLAVTLTSVLPPVLVPVGLLVGDVELVGVGAALWALEAAFRFQVERRDGRSGWIAPLHPLGAAVLVVAIVRSTLRRAVWKGRTFVGGQAGPQ